MLPTVELLHSLSEANLARFEKLLPEASDDETRAPLIELLAEERESMKRLVFPVEKQVEEASGPPRPALVIFGARGRGLRAALGSPAALRPGGVFFWLFN
jgi:hypothetical protein